MKMWKIALAATCSVMAARANAVTYILGGTVTSGSSSTSHADQDPSTGMLGPIASTNKTYTGDAFAASVTLAYFPIVDGFALGSASVHFITPYAPPGLSDISVANVIYDANSYTFTGGDSFGGLGSYTQYSFTLSFAGHDLFSNLGDPSSLIVANIDPTRTVFSISGTQTEDFQDFLYDNKTSTITADVDVVAAVPEVATWAMMIVGFGLVGGILRRTSQAERRLIGKLRTIPTV